MSMISDVKRDIQSVRKIHVSQRAILFIIFGSVIVTAIFRSLGQPRLSLPLMNFAGVVTFVLIVKWNLRRRVWFWLTMVALVVAHLVVIPLIPWTSKWVPAFMIAILDTVALMAILAVVSVVGNVCDRLESHR